MIRDVQLNLTARHGDAGLRWVLDRPAQWSLNDSELARLLGVPTERLLGWKKQVAACELVRLPPDVMERVGLLLGLHKSLWYLTPSGHEYLASEWFQKPINLWGLNGESIQSYLLKDPRIEVLRELTRDLTSAVV